LRQSESKAASLRYGGARAKLLPLRSDARPDLARVGRIMNERLREIDALYKLVRDRGGKDNEQ
jgi:hypothetical protein